LLKNFDGKDYKEAEIKLERVERFLHDIKPLKRQERVNKKEVSIDLAMDEEE